MAGRWACAMYYTPRLAPENPGMPVLGYFTVVGGALLGLLFLADAYMPRTQHLSFVSNVDGLPAAYKGEPAHVPAAAPHIAPLPAVVAETTGSGSGLALAGEAPKPAPTLTPAPVAQEAAKPVKRKVVRRHQPESRDEGFGSFGRHDFGRQDFGRHDFGRQEPSWRDSWASGAFQQAAEPRRRNVWRSGNDFGFFR